LATGCPPFLSRAASSSGSDKTGRVPATPTLRRDADHPQ
jgi:hypothetical protein